MRELSPYLGHLENEPEALGLLALMLLIESRRKARVTPSGEIVLLADQDTTLWDHALIAQGQALVRKCLRRNQPGPYQIQAAINAMHSEPPTESTRSKPLTAITPSTPSAQICCTA